MADEQLKELLDQLETQTTESDATVERTGIVSNLPWQASS